MNINLNENEVKTVLTLLYNEPWGECHGEEKLILVKELIKKLEKITNDRKESRL